MVSKKTTDLFFWIPINVWNLNELFTTESISPISFYKDRNFGNPVNRNPEYVEEENNLILFNNAIQNEILLRFSPDLLNNEYLIELKSAKTTEMRTFKYSKTIYLKMDLFKVYFSKQETLNEFYNNTYMLLEVKTVNKYRSNFVIDATISKTRKKATYQSQIIPTKQDDQPFFDKVYNQIKGMIYGYIIGHYRAFDKNEQLLVSELSKLKTSIGSVHTDIVLSEQYSNLWLVNTSKQIQECQKLYFDNFGEQSDAFDTLFLRLQEIDNLNNMRCSTIIEQKSDVYIEDYKKEQKHLEDAQYHLNNYMSDSKITPLESELEKIKQEEEAKGKTKGKTREYYKKDSREYSRKIELKKLIANFKNDSKYKSLKEVVANQNEKLLQFQFDFTKYDTSITEQFRRISEYLHELTKKTTFFFSFKE
jgi:hypothetical protein